MDTDPRSPVCLAPHFQFLEIDSNRGQIRLLEIAPGRGVEPIRCSYQIATADDETPYQTLSYVWGKMDGKKSIVVDSTEVELTDNLFDALMRIRHETEPRYLWVDALCINQEDGVEKTAQVNMMHKIYSSCVQCNMWMGNINVASLDTTESEALGAAKGALDAVQMIAGQEFESHPPLHLNGRDEQAKAGKALEALMLTPWWSRIWTVQEATSPRNATILWGPLSIPWSTMCKAAEKLISGDYPPKERTASALEDAMALSISRLDGSA
ncbi:hypothetical protein NUW58_g7184 [Xylaria curta]|uniref:Uncharacterized protein n=1 Tax=Xylaria curta TaxID=42375 RepID=A0ACC1NJJ7_9PEZI|nr:hypothetical protein NUW58_g7184 [Xylaria curta]